MGDVAPPLVALRAGQVRRTLHTVPARNGISIQVNEPLRLSSARLGVAGFGA